MSGANVKGTTEEEQKKKEKRNGPIRRHAPFSRYLTIHIHISIPHPHSLASMS
jgi:hypothetical protein